MRRPPRSSSAGFSLLEVVIALAVLMIGAVSVAQLAAVTGRAQTATAQAGVVLQIAREKMEQLHALAWTADATLNPITDLSSDLSVTPPAALGGPGLATAPGDALIANRSGYHDYVDASGRWLSGGESAPVGAAWTRRWSVQPLDGVEDTLLLQVVVVPSTARSSSAGLSLTRHVNGARLLSIRTRVAQ